LPFGITRDLLGSYQLILYILAAISLVLGLLSLFIQKPVKQKPIRGNPIEEIDPTRLIRYREWVEPKFLGHITEFSDKRAVLNN
jgi:hypothetical protein